MINYEDPKKTAEGFEYRLTTGNVLRLSQGYNSIRIRIPYPYHTKVHTSYDGYKWNTLIATSNLEQDTYSLPPSTLYIRLTMGYEIAFTLHNPNKFIEANDRTALGLLDLDSFVHKDEMERLKVEIENLKKFVGYRED